MKKSTFYIFYRNSFPTTDSLDLKTLNSSISNKYIYLMITIIHK